MKKIISVYLAGKISKNGWRQDIFPTLKAAECHGFDSRDEVIKGNFRYCGPFFISCDHGCFHGKGSHGRGVGKNWLAGSPCDEVYRKGSDLIKARKNVTQSCVQWINNADIIFAWIDDPKAYGTITEIGIAYQAGKPIFLAMPIHFEVFDDMWFAWTLSNYAVMVNGHMQAWDIFEAVSGRLI